MRFDLPTLAHLARCLDGHLAATSISSVEHDRSGLQIQFSADRFVQLTYHAQAAFTLVPSPLCDDDTTPSRAERFLLNAEFVEAGTTPRDRCLWLRLQRPDRDGKPTYAKLYFELIPPRFRAVLVSEGRGHRLGNWQAQQDRRSCGLGEPYLPPTSDRLLPGTDGLDSVRIDTEGQDHLRRWLPRTLAGATGAIVRVLCDRAQIDDSAKLGDLSPAQWERLWIEAEALYGTTGPDCWSWEEGDGHQVSVVQPIGSVHTTTHESLIEALATPRQKAAPVEPRVRKLEQYLRRRQHRIQHSLQAMEADLDEAASADQHERQGSLLLAESSQIPPGARRVEIPDPFAAPSAMLCFELEPGQSASQLAAKMLKQAQKLRRRGQVLPEKIKESRHELKRITDLLARVRDPAGELTDQEWQAMKTEMGHVSQTGKGERINDDRQGARPRRYRTTSGWCVWAGRNNKENDTLTHRLAAQNDYWFHAHGYAGSHVLLRREGHTQEPDKRTLEEAAAVAAYWSKGRTAGKVPVVYTMAKFVSKPRGAPPGLAVMKREKTIMVRPDLIPEDDA